MENQQNPNPNSLLDVDLDAIAAAGKKEGRRKRILLVTAAAVVAVVLIVVLVVIPASEYKSAEALLAAGEFDNAIAAFTDLGDYKDATERITECYYQQAVALLKDEQYKEAAIAFGKAGDYSDASQRSFDLWNDITRDIISGGYTHTVGIQSDGTVVTVGYNRYGQCDVSDWTDIKVPE